MLKVCVQLKPIAVHADAQGVVMNIKVTFGNRAKFMNSIL